ncbi:hypothetical protein LCGC14_0591310 [marine sediment metagenome]|uniref:Uncharacterized protein n=1 Tax=marine sediment metagenome TaxID=412755 RepID=A0A0F9RIC8_9ZZZZ
MEKDFHKEFSNCPSCGSEDRFLEQLGNELKERGLARPEWSFHMDVRQGVVLDPTKEAALPIGSEIPGYAFKTDICMGCGCIYATDITRADLKKQVMPPQIIPPNRAQRRRDAREFPFSSS